MQLLGCANLYAIIFAGVKCREVLVVRSFRQKDKELWNAAGVSFYEHLGDL